MKEDFLVVGAGPFGCTFARLAADVNLTSRIVDKRPHIAGNAFDKKVHGINVHQYGAHIFHTGSDDIWRFVNQFGEFFNYTHYVVGKNGPRLFPVPINLQTMEVAWNAHGKSAGELAEMIALRRKSVDGDNVESWCLSHIGESLYDMVVKHYTEKQWGRPCAELPASIIRRLPVRHDRDCFGTQHQGLPRDGYTELFATIPR